MSTGPCLLAKQEIRGPNRGFRRGLSLAGQRLAANGVSEAEGIGGRRDVGPL